jgi:hypothetical protein
MIYMPRQLRPQRRQAIGSSVDPVPKTGLRGSEGQGVGDFPREEPGFAADEEEVCDVRILCGEEDVLGEGEGVERERRADSAVEGEDELELAMRWQRRRCDVKGSRLGRGSPEKALVVRVSRGKRSAGSSLARPSRLPKTQFYSHDRVCFLPLFFSDVQKHKLLPCSASPGVSTAEHSARHFEKPHRRLRTLKHKSKVKSQVGEMHSSLLCPSSTE